MTKILVAVAWPYASGPRHIGHAAGAYIPADVFARYHRMAGNDVLMVSGSDMHGTPTTVRADEEGVPPREVAERFHALHQKNFGELGLSFDLYWKTSDPGHKAVAQDVFLRLKEGGHIYEKTMDASWCPSCKKFRPDRYIEGECPHCGFPRSRGDQCEECGRMLDPFDLGRPRCKVCGSAVERRETRHFFFRLSAFQEPLKEWLETKTHWRPHVLHFTRAWLEEGLQDRPVTRDIDWGIEIPLEGYDTKRIYVWFEAVMGYLTASMEWARRRGDADAWKAWWHDPDARQYYFVGKDNIVFHTIIWPAILMAYDPRLNLPYDVPANQYMNFGGARMSAGRGVGVWLSDLLEAFDADVLRYYVTASMPETKDTEFTLEDLARRTNTELVAIYGNFVHRALTFAHKHFDAAVPPAGFLGPPEKALLRRIEDQAKAVGQNVEYVHLREALREAMELARAGNRYFDQKAPWDLVKRDKAACGSVIHVCLRLCKALAIVMQPFLPFSSQRLWEMLGFDGPVAEVPWAEALEDIPAGQGIGDPKPLFPRVDLSQTPLGEEERLDVRVARIVSVEDHPDADKLYVLRVDVGDETRQIVAGLRENYTREELTGRKIALLVNLEPAKLRGVRSNGMLLAAEDEDDVGVLLPPEDAPVGAQILGRRDAPTLPFKEFERLKLVVGEEKRVYFRGSADRLKVPLKVGDAFVVADKDFGEGAWVH
jgi:methionyl-tRNA synthetase